jgi:hypothetical protein
MMHTNAESDAAIVAKCFTEGAKMQIISRVRDRWFYWFADVDIVFSVFILVLGLTFQNLKFLSLAIGKLRRFWLVHFRRRYVRNQLATRQGACLRCGACCNLLITCPMLTKNEHCLVYGTCRPQACKVFPIDQRDVKDVRTCGAQCGYYFAGHDFEED